MATTEDHLARNLAAMQAVQSGVATKMAVDPSETSPKSLRVGVNSALVSASALARLLVDKGVITMEEYTKAIADGAEEEKARYEAWLTDHYGRTVNLG